MKDKLKAIASAIFGMTSIGYVSYLVYLMFNI